MPQPPIDRAAGPSRSGRVPSGAGLSLAAGLVLSALAAPALAQGGPPQGPPPVTVAKPIVREVVDTDEFTGRFEALESVEVRARVTGYLDTVSFRDGSLVTKGDLLFTIDPRPYRAALDQSRAAVEAAKTRLEFAEGNRARAEALRRTGNISEQLLDQRQQDFLTARADVDRAEAQLRQSQLDIDFTEIRAPISGRIGRKLVTEGNLVNANTSVLASIVALDPIAFYFDIDERTYLTYAREIAIRGQPADRAASNGNGNGGRNGGPSLGVNGSNGAAANGQPAPPAAAPSAAASPSAGAAPAAAAAPATPRPANGAQNRPAAAPTPAPAPPAPTPAANAGNGRDAEAVAPRGFINVLLSLTDERQYRRPGRIDFVDNRVDAASGTVRIRAVVPNADLVITPGLFGRIVVPGTQPYRGVLVPDEAVASDLDRRFVWVVAEDGTASQRVVRPGPRTDGYRVIRSGLEGTETIVVSGLQRVRPGAKVTPQMTTLPPTR